jgi:hypothetical protein
MVGTVAVVGPAGAARTKVAKCVGDAGIAVLEMDELTTPRRFIAIVVVDERDDPSDGRARVMAWLGIGSTRIVVMTPKPAAWTPLARSYERRLAVLPAPAFSWQIVDCLRALIGDDDSSG